MSDPMKQAWNDVADGFSTLGKMVKTRYEGEPDATTSADAAVAADAGAGAGAGSPSSGGDAFTALRDALQHLIDAGRDLGDRATDFARDEEIKAQVKRAAGSLNDALSATVDMIGEQVGSLFKRQAPTPTETNEVIQATAGPASPAAANDTEARDGADESPS